ncbi:hypothetical protein HDU97_007191 [Phlyctochytrium planicorne]|nr:hypothetical protein HDU97_007191 [Phlyctochytrium planicorne]
MRLLSPSTPTGQWLLNIFNFAVLTAAILALVVATRSASSSHDQRGRYNFNTIATFLLLAVLKVGLSIALFIHQRYNAVVMLPSEKQQGIFSESFAEVKSMAVLGALYSVFGVLGYNPYGLESFSKPTVAHVVSFLLTTIILKFWRFEKLDRLQWISLAIAGGAFLNFVAISCRSSEGLLKWSVVAGHCMLRIFHSLELKTSTRGSLHFKNIILNLSSVCTLALLYVIMDIIVSKDFSSPIRISVSMWILTTLIQSILELIVTGIFKYSSVIVSELSMAVSVIVSTLAFANSREKSTELFSLKVMCLVVALLAVIQYLFGGSGANPSSSGKSDRQEISNSSLTTTLIFDILEDEEDLSISKKPLTTGLNWKLAALPVVVIAMTIFGFVSKNATLTSKTPEVDVEVDGDLNFSLATTFSLNNRSRWSSDFDDDDVFYGRGFAVVIPAISYQLTAVDNLLKSFERFCMDCDKVRFVVIPSKDEVETFEKLKEKYTFIKKLEVKAFSEFYADLRDPKIYSSESEFLKDTTMYTFNSMKKLTGCLYLNTKYCWMLEPEAFMFQDTSIKSMVKDFFLDPRIVYSSHEKFEMDFTVTAKSILGYKEHTGWPVEEYSWFMEIEILREVRLAIDAKYPKAKDLSPIILVEVLYYLYIIHNRQDYRQYRLVDTSNLFGPYFENALKTVDVRRGGSIEDLRHVIAEYPSILAPFAERYTAYGLNFYKAKGEFGTLNSSAVFLDLAYSAKMCLGEQDPEMFDLAMTGRWARRKPTFPKREIEDYCLNFESVC